MEDIKIEIVDSRPKGGQQVGVLPIEVKVTHIPSGLTASCKSERSQLRNRDVAISMIEWGLTHLTR